MANQKNNEEENNVLLEYRVPAWKTHFFRVLPMLALGGVGLVFFVMVLNAAPTWERVAGVLWCLVLYRVYFLLMNFVIRVRLLKSGVEITRAWGRPGGLPWNEVRSLKKAAFGLYALRFKPVAPGFYLDLPGEILTQMVAMLRESSDAEIVVDR